MGQVWDRLVLVWCVPWWSAAQWRRSARCRSSSTPPSPWAPTATPWAPAARASPAGTAHPSHSCLPQSKSWHKVCPSQEGCSSFPQCLHGPGGWILALTALLQFLMAIPKGLVKHHPLSQLKLAPAFDMAKSCIGPCKMCIKTRPQSLRIYFFIECEETKGALLSRLKIATAFGYSVFFIKGYGKGIHQVSF